MTAIRFSDYAHIVFFTGAGTSAASGVPTYRGKGGIWKEYDYEAYACQSAFERDPDRVWEFHNFRRDLVAKCAPNAAHTLIAELESQRPEAITVITQNIDGLHQLAGSRTVHELHGSLWRVRCDACGATHEGREVPLANLHCSCGAYWRPDIVWFGDALRGETLRTAMKASLEAELFLSIGTSGVVYPAAQLPSMARQGGAVCVEINTEPTAISDVHHHILRGDAGEVLAGLR